jgi:integrase
LTAKRPDGLSASRQRREDAARKPLRIITTEQFDAIHYALQDETLRLFVETDIETGLRWGELTELHVKDIEFVSGVLTVSRAVVELNPRFHPEGKRFLVKDYPKDKQWRQVRIAGHLIDKILHVVDRCVGHELLTGEYAQ